MRRTLHKRHHHARYADADPHVVTAGRCRAAGLSKLQRLLESGFETFKSMKGARDFLATVDQRERYLAHLLFQAKSQGPDSIEALSELLP